MSSADVKSRVAARLRGNLHADRIRPGARLPTERALAAEEGCDRRTARAALDLLEGEGLIRRVSPHVRVAAYPVERTPAVFMHNSILLVTEQDPHPEERGRNCGTHLREADLGVLSAAQAGGLHVLTFSRSRLDGAELASALALQPRGVVVSEPALLGGAILGLLQPLCRERGTPLVTCSDAPDCRTVDRVVSDHQAGGQMLVEWLIARKCRQILEVGVSTEASYWVAARTQGYLAGCVRAAVAPLPRVHVPGVFWVGRGRSEFERAARFFAGYLAEWLVPGRIDAVMAQNDIDAVLVLEACRVLGLDGAKRPLVTGYDNMVEDHPIRHWSTCRPAATIEKHNRAQGEAMLDLVLERASGGLPLTPVRRLVPPELVVNRA